MSDNKKLYKDMVVMYIAGQDTVDELLIDQKMDEVRMIPLFINLTEKDVEEVRAQIKSELTIKLDKGILIEEKGHEKWFLNKKPQLEMKYWERYKKYLISDNGFSNNVVNTMDDILDVLTDLLGDPTRNVSYNRRGLIIGDVQSGKTANYTGLMCKAADSGYKVIVLLTGTIEKLRQQTQKRIDEGFVGADSNAMMKQIDDKIIIGVGKYDSSIRPMVLTSTADDFKTQNARNLNFDLRNINGSVVFVVKKNSSVLKRLNKWLSTYNQNGENLINHSLLVIDDEADNASVNTKADPEDTPTAINGQIRKLLQMFEKSSYVGFTATPFANIFIDPESINDMFADDLFPKDYVYSLNSPSNYTGARDIFDDNGKAKNMLVRINDNVEDEDSIASLIPLSHKQTIYITHLPYDLETAICTFMLANTIEDIMGIKGNHRSMLINVSRFTNVQDQVAMLVNSYLKNMQAACRNYAKLEENVALKSLFIKRLYDTYNDIYADLDFEWIDIQKHLHTSCANIMVQLFNQKSGKNFNYDDYKNGLRVIAVGGMSLSRGLTLEGLVVSYFYRNSKMYDTLMQMGRWFGYRNKYFDLCKIFMSEESIEWYKYISQATDELRNEIKGYEDTGLTPMDFGLRVRSDMTTLLVTARNKMRTAESRECVISLSGEVIETPELYSDIAKNIYNKECSIKLVSQLKSAGYTPIKIKTIDDNYRTEYHNVSKDIILDYLKEIEVSPKNIRFNTNTIVNFISEYKGTELNEWDIAFANGRSSNIIDLGENISYHYTKRLFTIENDGKIIRINGAKTRIGSRSNGEFGLTKEQIKNVESICGKNPAQRKYFTCIKRRPLLIVYFIELNTRNEETNKAIIQMSEENKNNPFVGYSIGIPMLSNQETKYARYLFNKVAIQQIFEGEYVEFDEESD